MELQDVFDVAQHAQFELKTYFYGVGDMLKQCLCAMDRPISSRFAIDTIQIIFSSIIQFKNKLKVACF